MATAVKRNNFRTFRPLICRCRSAGFRPSGRRRRPPLFSCIARVSRHEKRESQELQARHTSRVDWGHDIHGEAQGYALLHTDSQCRAWGPHTCSCSLSAMVRPCLTAALKIWPSAPYQKPKIPSDCHRHAHALEGDATSIKGSEMNVFSTCQRSFAIAREDRILPPFACARQSEPPAAKADLSGGSLLPGTSRRECGGRESSHGTLSTV